MSLHIGCLCMAYKGIYTCVNCSKYEYSIWLYIHHMSTYFYIVENLWKCTLLTYSHGAGSLFREICHLTHMASWTSVNISSVNSLLSKVTKSLPKPMLTNHQSCRIQFHGKYSRYQSLSWVWKWLIKNQNCITREAMRYQRTANILVSTFCFPGVLHGKQRIHYRCQVANQQRLTTYFALIIEWLGCKRFWIWATQ